MRGLSFREQAGFVRAGRLITGRTPLKLTKMANARIIPANPDALFLPFQERWIKDDSRLKLMEKSRQIGISWSTAYKAAERTAMTGQKWDQWISSRDDLQARLFIEDCKMFANILQIAASDLGERVIDYGVCVGIFQRQTHSFDVVQPRRPSG